MPERLVDVEKQGSKVLHTFPVTISAPAVEEEAFKEKALEAAGNAKLVPNEELETSGIKRSINASANAPTHCGAGRLSGKQGGRALVSDARL
jgi:hypothetical protein